MGDFGLAVLFSFLAAFGFASGYILIRVGMQRVPAPTATFFSVLTGAILLLGLAVALNLPDIKALTPVALGWFAVMGLIAYPLARLLNNSAITMVGVSRAAPMASLQPIFVFGLGMALLGERPNLLVSIGTLMVVGGLVMVFLTQINANSTDRLPSAKNLGFLLAMGGALAFASRDVISRHVVTDVANPLVTAAFALALGGCMLLMVIHRDVLHSLRRLPGGYIAICGLAGICSGLAVASLFQALNRAPVTVVSPINASSPLFALVLVHLFLQRLESISPILVGGTLLSVGGVVMVILGASAS